MMPDPLQELLAAGAVPARPFPPTSRYRGVAPGSLVRDGGRPGVRLRAAPLLPARRDIRARREVRIVEGDRPRRARRAQTSATPSCGGASPTRTASIDPRELDRPARVRVRDHAAARPVTPGERGTIGGRHAVRLQLSLMGPVSPCRRRARCIEALCRPRSKPAPARRRAASSSRSSSRLRSPLQTLFLLTGGGSIPIIRVVIVVTHRRRDDGADGRRDDATTRCARDRRRRARWSSRARTCRR